MKIRILRNTVVGGEAVKAGTVVEASEADARYLLAANKAEAVADATAPEPEPVEALKRKPRTKVTPDGDLSTDP